MEDWISSHAEIKNTAIPTSCIANMVSPNKNTPQIQGMISPAVPNMELSTTVPLFIAIRLLMLLMVSAAPDNAEMSNTLPSSGNPPSAKTKIDAQSAASSFV